MDIKRLILDKISKKGQIKSSEIVKQTGFSRAYINRFFGELLDEGQIIAFGKTKSTFYVLANKNAVNNAKKDILEFNKTFKNKNLKEDLVLADIKKKTGIFVDLPKNISNILDYAFTEMLNNAIDHSQSDEIIVSIKRQKKEIIFSIFDFGVGIFNNIKSKFKLDDELQAIDFLWKGKQTTDPKKHSGQGIFFTSKIADSFLIVSGNKKIRFLNKLDDIFVDDVKNNIKGTRISFFIDLNTTKTAKNVFDEYTDLEFEFTRTKIKIKLFKVGKNLISRSEAKRIMIGLDKFEEIILDFKDVDTVGQGFADEVFRVWQNKYPKIKIKFINVNENVEFMIRRAII